MDQRELEARPDVLSFTSPVLQTDVEVTGPVMVHLWACTTAPDTDFVARLVDVYPDGRAMSLTDGIVRGSYAVDGLLEPNKPYEFVVDLWATSNVFKAGHRIRVDITSSSFPRWDRNPNTGRPLGSDAELRTAQQTILHDAAHPSRIVLPIVP
jgi:putative CocE/NonD family hydrolase